MHQKLVESNVERSFLKYLWLETKKFMKKFPTIHLGNSVAIATVNTSTNFDVLLECNYRLLLLLYRYVF